MERRNNDESDEKKFPIILIANRNVFVAHPKLRVIKSTFWAIIKSIFFLFHANPFIRFCTKRLPETKSPEESNYSVSQLLWINFF